MRRSYREVDISATEAARKFSDILNRVASSGESFVVRRRGRPVCWIVPVGPATCSLADLATVFREAPRPDAGYWNDLEEIIRRQPSLPGPPW
jgi:prevent-host-death family protein